MLVTCLIVANTALLLGLIVLLATFKRGLPDLLQGALNDVAEQFNEIFKNPAVSRAMSVLGSKSGEVRADKALKNKVAEKALGQNVLLKKALEYLDITPMEGIELMGDPTIGPVIKNLMAGFSKGGQGLLSGLGSNNPGGNPPHSRGRGVPLMS